MHTSRRPYWIVKYARVTYLSPYRCHYRQGYTIAAVVLGAGDARFPYRASSILTLCVPYPSHLKANKRADTHTHMQQQRWQRLLCIVVISSLVASGCRFET